MKEAINLNNGMDVYDSHKSSFKTKRNADWYEPMADYYIDLAESLNDTNLTVDALNAAKGVVSDSVMQEVLEQINDKAVDVTVKELNILDDVDIITPIKERYLGDFVKTPNFYTCTLEGEDITLALKHKTQGELFKVFTNKLELELDKIRKEEEAVIQAQQEAQERAEQTGQAMQQEQKAADIGSPSDAAEDAEEMEMRIKKIKKDYFNKEAMKAKDLVEFFVKEVRLEEKLYQLFYYFFATEQVYVKFNPSTEDIGLEILHPAEYLRIPTVGSVFVEDDNEGVVKRKKSIKAILDDHGDKLSKDDVDYLTTLLASGSTGSINVSKDILLSRQIEFSKLANQYKENLGTNAEAVFANSANEVEEYEIFFTTKRKIGTLHYLDELGEVQQTEVGETYKLDEVNGDLKINWWWLDEVWSMFRWGNGNGVGVYTKPFPIPVQRADLNIKNSTTLPIIGLDGILNDFGRKPIPLRMLSHQALYLILTNKYRKEMAKFHGFVNLLAESVLSDSDEFTQAERLNYMYKDNLLIINDTEVDANTLQSSRTIGNSGQADYIRVIDEMRKGIKAEAWDLANMNDQRYGNIDVRGGKGNNEEAIRRVSTGSILLFTMFDMFKERLYQAMSDYGRMTYTNGINKGYSNKDGENVELSYTHEELISATLGIHFTTNAIEKEKIESIRNAIVSASIQSGNTLDAIDALKENDLESLRKYSEELQKAKEAREERLAKQEQDAQKYIEDRKNELEDKKIKNDSDIADKKGEYELLLKDKEIYKTMLELQSNEKIALMGKDGNGNGVPDNYVNNTNFDDDIQFIEGRIKEAQLSLLNEKVVTEKKKHSEIKTTKS